MNNSELAQLGAMIASEHPKFTFVGSDGAPNSKFKLWSFGLREFSGDLVLQATKAHLMRSEWPPTLANIVTIIKEADASRIEPAGDAYSEVQKLVSRWGIYNQAAALKEAKPITRRIIKQIGWREICHSDNPEALRAHFLKLYDQQVLRAVKRSELEDVIKVLPARNEISRLVGSVAERLECDGEKELRKPVLLNRIPSKGNRGGE